MGFRHRFPLFRDCKSTKKRRHSHHLPPEFCDNSQTQCVIIKKTGNNSLAKSILRTVSHFIRCSFENSSMKSAIFAYKGRFSPISSSRYRPPKASEIAFSFPKWCVLHSKTVRFALQNGAFCILKWCILHSKMVHFAF